MQTCIQFPRRFGFALERSARAQPIPLSDDKDLRTLAMTVSEVTGRSAQLLDHVWLAPHAQSCAFTYALGHSK